MPVPIVVQHLHHLDVTCEKRFTSATRINSCAFRHEMRLFRFSAIYLQTLYRLCLCGWELHVLMTGRIYASVLEHVMCDLTSVFWILLIKLQVPLLVKIAFILFVSWSRIFGGLPDRRRSQRSSKPSILKCCSKLQPS